MTAMTEVLETQLRQMTQTELVRFRDLQRRPLAVRRLTEYIWHVEKDGTPICAGGAAQIAQWIREA